MNQVSGTNPPPTRLNLFWRHPSDLGANSGSFDPSPANISVHACRSSVDFGRVSAAWSAVIPSAEDLRRYVLGIGYLADCVRLIRQSHRHDCLSGMLYDSSSLIPCGFLKLQRTRCFFSLGFFSLT